MKNTEPCTSIDNLKDFKVILSALIPYDCFITVLTFLNVLFKDSRTYTSDI